MDIKAMAKSKRSHTRQNQPRKHIHLSKTLAASSPSTSGNPNAEKKEGRERKREVKAETPSLPSNWDRYEDEVEEEDAVELPIDSNSDERSRLADSNVVKPKSKGANLGDLIAQAKESRSSYSPSFHDTLPDFYQGLGPLLSVKGESILSWEGGDDFLADDEATSTQEASFLSLDLQDLAKQLAKVDLAKRLFIEADLLPPELRGQEADESHYQTFFERSERQKKIRVPETFDELLSLYLEEEQNAEQEKDEGTDGLMSSSLQAHAKDNILHEVGSLDDREPSLVTHVTEKYSKPSSEFEATAAEEELDMLLNSFSETKPFGSSAIQSDIATSTKLHTTPTSSVAENSCVGIPVTSSLDDALDNLLEETSKQDNKDGLSQSTVVKATSFHLPSSSSSSSSHPSSKSKVLDDFDSWFDTI